MTVLIVIVVTVLFSRQAFNDASFLHKLIFNPYQIIHRNQYYRLFTHGLVHNDWMHLIINMMVLFSFGEAFIKLFEYYTNLSGNLYFLIVYLLALPISSLITLAKHKDNPSYNAVGASGAVAAIVFACIYFNPWSLLYLFAVIPIPGIVFGVVYLFYSYRMAQKGTDNVGHDAHFAGAMFGLLFTAIIRPETIANFIQQLTTWPF